MGPMFPKMQKNTERVTKFDNKNRINFKMQIFMAISKNVDAICKNLSLLCHYSHFFSQSKPSEQKKKLYCKVLESHTHTLTHSHTYITHKTSSERERARKQQHTSKITSAKSQKCNHIGRCKTRICGKLCECMPRVSVMLKNREVMSASGQACKQGALPDCKSRLHQTHFVFHLHIKAVMQRFQKQCNVMLH